MKKAGVYISIKNGVIWQVEKLEHYPASVVPDGSGEFSILTKGMVGDQKINRCYVPRKQYKLFKYIGDL